MLLTAIKENFSELTSLIERLSPEEYTRPCPELNDSTIGAHIRHILEMYQCLDKAYVSGVVEYDKRERDFMIQNKREFALKAIEDLGLLLDRPNKDMKLKSEIDSKEIVITTNYERELLYNLEHSIHHQALIKVGVRQCETTVDDNFGVAKSTIAFRQQCAQ